MEVRLLRAGRKQIPDQNILVEAAFSEPITPELSESNSDSIMNIF